VKTNEDAPPESSVHSGDVSRNMPKVKSSAQRGIKPPQVL
jgi:hypothetical protein